MGNAQPLLTCRSLQAFYGDSQALFGVDLDLYPGEVVAVLGRNGVGKTTLMRSIAGLLPPRRGEVRLGGLPISGRPPHAIARMGVAYVPQGREIFSDLTVAENLRLGTVAAGQDRTIPGQVLEYFPILRERLRQRGGSMSGGQQQMLAIARALAGRPRLLLLDEPTEGIQPSIVTALCRVLAQINTETGLSMVLVEQNLDFALRLARRVYIMEKGRMVFAGTREELTDDLLRQHLAV